MLKKVRVWDLPTRAFHWLLALCVSGLFITGLIGGNWFYWHEKLGYVVLALVLFRVLWGFVGSETSRFSDFVHRPRVITQYLKTGASPTLGHNPLGALSILGLLGLLLLQAATGLIVDDEIANKGPLIDKVPGAWVALATTIHRVNKWVIGGAVLLHLAAIFYYTRIKKEKLIRPMFFGDREVDRAALAPQVRSSVRAAIALAIACGLVYWLVTIFPKS